MRRAEQIAAALALLAPPPSECEECRHDIEQMLDWVDSRSRAARADKTFTSKRGKASLRRYVKALRQLKAAYDALGPSIKPWFSLAETAYVVGKPTVIDRELAKAEPLLANPRRPNLTPSGQSRPSTRRLTCCDGGGTRSASHATANGSGWLRPSPATACLFLSICARSSMIQLSLTS
jgi:hypothetical protein